MKINYANGMSYTAEELEKILNSGNKLIFRHFKGSIYVADSIASYSENHDKKFMCYHSTNASNVTRYWVRDLDMFLSEVDHEKYPDITQKMRFELIKIEERRRW